MTITPQEVKSWLAQGECARFKEISTDLLYDAMLAGEDSVLVRLASPYPTEIYLMTLEKFVTGFEEFWGPQSE